MRGGCGGKCSREGVRGVCGGRCSREAVRGRCVVGCGGRKGVSTATRLYRGGRLEGVKGQNSVMGRGMVAMTARDTVQRKGFAPGLQAGGRGGAAPPTGPAARGPPLHLGPGHADHLPVTGAARKFLLAARVGDGVSWPHSCTCEMSVSTNTSLDDLYKCIIAVFVLGQT